MTTERERFEAWLEAVRDKADPGDWLFSKREAAWKAWQAALSAPPGYVLVPVEPTPEMLDAAVQAICYGPEGGFTRISGPGKTWRAMCAAAPSAKEPQT